MEIGLAEKWAFYQALPIGLLVSRDGMVCVWELVASRHMPPRVRLYVPLCLWCKIMYAR